MNKKMKKVLLSALPTLTVATSFACLTSCSNTDMFHGCDAFLIDGQGQQHWISSLVKNNICPTGETLEDIVDNDGNRYHRSEFNYQIIINPKLVEIPDNFLINCSTFNQGIVLNHTQISIIGNNFLRGCSAFNHKISFPPSTKWIGSGFLQACGSFNSDIVFNDGLSNIGSSFMLGCHEFDKDINLPESITQIPAYFMNSCTNFSKTIYLPTTTRTIGNAFVNDCHANFTIANLEKCTSLSGISARFLAGCTNFNHNIDLSNTHIFSSGIANYFMYNCYNMSKPTENENICYINLGNLPMDVFIDPERTGDTNFNLAMLSKGEHDQITIYLKGKNLSTILDWPKNFTDEKGSNYYRSLEVLPE